MYVVEGDSYRPVERSRLVPDLDFDVLTRFVVLGDQHEAVQRYRNWLREGDVSQ